MPNRRTFLAGSAAAVAAGAVALTAPSTAAAATKTVHIATIPTLTPAAVGGADGFGTVHVTSITAISKVFGIGQKCIAVAIEYDATIQNSRLSTATYKVDDRTITKVYAAHTAATAARGTDGRFVIIELSPDDAAALLWVQLPKTGGMGGPPAVGDHTRSFDIVPASATVTQIGVVTTTAGRHYAPDPTTSLISNKTKNLIVDDFEQFSFADPATGRTLTYNLFIPKNYNPRKKYPLLLFMHDAGPVAAATLGPLVQGTGAVVWASPEDQAKHPCFVLAPEFPEVVIGDDYEPSTYFDAAVNLLEAVANKYSVDKRRLYSTGQSMGAMLTLGINIRYPGLLAASYVVAGQWPDDQAKPLADAKLWVTVSEGDTKAFPMENAIMTVVKAAGTKVAEASWDATSTQAQLDADARALEAQHAPINYAHFKVGTLPGTQPGGTGNEHTSTWQVAYNIPEIRDWIMKQSL